METSTQLILDKLLESEVPEVQKTEFMMDYGITAILVNVSLN